MFRLLLEDVAVSRLRPNSSDAGLNSAQNRLDSEDVYKSCDWFMEHRSSERGQSLVLRISDSSPG